MADYPEGTRVQNTQTGQMFVFTNGRFEAEVPSMRDTFARETVTSLLDNLSNVPAATANQVMQGIDQASNPLQRAVNFGADMMGVDKPFNTNIYGQNVSDILPGRPSRFANEPEANVPQLSLPNLGDEFLGIGSYARDVLTGAQTPTASNVAADIQDSIRSQELTRSFNRETNPMTAAAGDLTGDALSLVTLKAPGAPARGQSALYSRINADAIANQAKRGMDDGAARIAELQANPGLLSAITDTFSKTGNYLASRSGRVAEAGADGYIIGMLNDQDPKELAAFGAGGQAAGSLALSLATAPFEGGSINLKRLAGTAIGFAAVTQLIKEIVPGGEDGILDSVEGGFWKTAATIASAVPFSLMGAGRITRPERIANAIPGIMDSISTLQRGAVLSAIGEYQQDNLTRQVMDKFVTDPQYFGSTAARQIDRAIRVENVSLKDTINRLNQNATFRTAVGNL